MPFNKLLLTIAILTSSSLAHAEMFKIQAEIGAYFPNETSVSETTQDAETSLSGTFIFEHPLPIIPNARIDTTSIETSGYEFNLSSGTIYYQFTDNGFIDIDGGIGASFIHNSTIVGNEDKNFDAPMIHGFVEANVYMPFHPSLSVYANVFKMYGEKEEGLDYKAGIRYNFDFAVIKMTATGGFRQISLDSTENSKRTLSSQGAFFNLGFII